MKLIETTEPDNRPLKEILDEIDVVALNLSYNERRLIQEDLCTILERYGKDDTE